MSTSQAIILDRKPLLAGQSAQLITLLQASYVTTSADTPAPLDTQHVIEIIRRLDLSPGQTLIDAINKQRSIDARPGPVDTAIIAFIEQFFSDYTQFGQLHNKLKQALKILRKPATIAMLQCHQWPWQTQPDLAQTLQLIHQHSIGWHPELGKAATTFLTTLTALLNDLANSADNHAFETVNQQLVAFFHKQAHRISKSEKRLCDTEKGILHARHAYWISARTLNQLMAGMKLPKVISDFLQGPLHSSMQLILINHTQDSHIWRDCVKLTETLIGSFQPIGDDPLKRQQIFQSISQITEQLPETMVSLHHSDHQLASQLALIEQEHLKVLRNEMPDYAAFDLIDNTDPLFNAQTVISKSLLKQVDLLTQEQWFYCQNEQTTPMKLALKLDDARQLLFTNFLGVKKQSYRFEEFAYKLSSRAISPISKKDHYQLTGEMLINKLYDDYQTIKQQQAAIYAQKQQALKKRLKAQEAMHSAALEQARTLARTQQQERLKKENQIRMAEAERRKAVSQHRQQGKITTSINRLNTGGIVEFYNDMGESQQLKLAVKLQSSDKFVFVDQSGIKREQWFKKDLEKMLDEGSIKIVDEGAYFEDSLEKVVNGLRKGRK